MKVASYNDQLAVWELIVEPVEIEGKHRPWEISLKVLLVFSSNRQHDFFVCFTVKYLDQFIFSFFVST